jgi:hypothetical protein
MAANSNKSPIGIVAAVFICCLGSAAIAWGCFAIPIVWRQSGLEQVASHIIGGDRFAANTLTALTPQLDAGQSGKWDHPSAVRNDAVIRVRILENAIFGGDPQAVDSQMTKVHEAIDKSLANAPADPFLWVVLFWLENTQNGYNPRHLKYLRMSYLLGPSEGWIAVKRNRIALALFPQLSSDLAEDAKAEFVRLVESRFYSEAADILIGPGWAIRNTLLPRLKNATELDRQLFARTVYQLGYDIVVPGVEPREQRPWD